MRANTARDPNAAGWEQVFASRAWGRYPPEALVRFVSRRFGGVTRKRDVRVLEVGCGPGANLWYLAREGFSVSGIDFSPTALEIAAGRLKDDGLDVQLDLRNGDFASLPWPDEYFDAVIDVEAISANNLGTIRAVLEEIRRVLRPGGVFFGIMFGRETTGYDRSVECEPGTIERPRVGPCQNQELAHFFDEVEFRQLFSDFSQIDLDWMKRTDGGREIVVSEWLVRAER